MISVQSMLSEPNENSPANIDAAKQYRDNRAQFKKLVRRTVQDSLEEMWSVCYKQERKEITMSFAEDGLGGVALS